MKIIQVIIILLTTLYLFSCTNPYEGEGGWQEDWIATINSTGDSLNYITKDYLGGVQFIPDTTTILINRGSAGIWTMNIDGTDIKCINDSANTGYEIPCISSDGTKIVFSDGDVYTMNIDGTNLQCLTYTPDVIDRYPHFSPDGSQIVYTTILDTFYSIYVIEENGSNKRKIISNINVGRYTYPIFSSNGEKIYYHLSGGQERGLYLFNLVDSTNTILFNGNTLFNPISTSEDGSKVVFSTSYIVYIINTDDMLINELFNESDNARISNDANKVVFDGIGIINSDGTEQKWLAKGRNPVFSSDGEKIVFIAEREFPENKSIVSP